jgi:hypothetical protein
MTAAHIVRRGMARATLSAGLALAFVAGCSDNPAKPIEGAGDPENISRVTITLTPVGSTTSQTSFRVDPDGTQLPQPVGAAQGTLALTKGTTYNGSIALKNDLDPNNVVDISAEVKKEANFHRFFYTFVVTGSSTACSGISVPESSMDVDTQSPTPQPVGLTFQLVVTASATSTTTCTMHVELHHFETAKGDGNGSTFDTDLKMDFPVTIS